ncbi:hypothetical protein PFISCL1PPCAC_22549, partial [Pristionchus fissidentatus]
QRWNRLRLSIAEEWAELVASIPIDSSTTPNFLEASKAFLDSPIVDSSSDDALKVADPVAPIQNYAIDHNEPSIPVETVDEVTFREGSERFDTDFHAADDRTTEFDHTIRPTSVCGYIRHLDRNHQRTMLQCEIHLACACGHKIYTQSDYQRHRDKCELSGFSIVYEKRPNPFTPPKCILCEHSPVSVHAFAVHLSVRHDTTLLRRDNFTYCAHAVAHSTQRRPTWNATRTAEAESIQCRIPERDRQDLQTHHSTARSTFQKGL